MLGRESLGMQSNEQTASAPVLRALVGVLAIYVPVVIAFLAGIGILPAIGFIAACWATEWLVAYVVGSRSAPSA